MADIRSLERDEQKLIPIDYNHFFTDYLNAFNQALDGDLDTDLIRGFFTDTFLASGADQVKTVKNNLWFGFLLRRSYSFYRKIGTRRLHLLGTNSTAIDSRHDMVRVTYRADYVHPFSRQPISLEFTVVYMIQRSMLYPRIFAFVAGDEMQAYRDAGLI